MSSAKLKALQKAAKAHQRAGEALMHAYKTNASGFELVRLGKEVEKTAQAHLNLIASITGEPPPKITPSPLRRGTRSRKAQMTTADGLKAGCTKSSVTVDGRLLSEKQNPQPSHGGPWVRRFVWPGDYGEHSATICERREKSLRPTVVHRRLAGHFRQPIHMASGPKGDPQVTGLLIVVIGTFG